MAKAEGSTTPWLIGWGRLEVGAFIVIVVIVGGRVEAVAVLVAVAAASRVVAEAEAKFDKLKRFCNFVSDLSKRENLVRDQFT